MIFVSGLYGKPSTVWSISATVLAFGAIFIYIIIRVLIHLIAQSDMCIGKIYKSIFMLCIIFIISWLFSCFGFMLCQLLNTSEEVSFFITLYLGVLFNISAISNFFILNKYSKDYCIASAKLFMKFEVYLNQNAK